jgi:hypothetical protein
MAKGLIPAREPLGLNTAGGLSPVAFPLEPPGFGPSNESIALENRALRALVEMWRGRKERERQEMTAGPPPEWGRCQVCGAVVSGNYCTMHMPRHGKMRPYARA